MHCFYEDVHNYGEETGHHIVIIKKFERPDLLSKSIKFTYIMMTMGAIDIFLLEIFFKIINYENNVRI